MTVTDTSLAAKAKDEPRHPAVVVLNSSGYPLREGVVRLRWGCVSGGGLTRKFGPVAKDMNSNPISRGLCLVSAVEATVLVDGDPNNPRQCNRWTGSDGSRSRFVVVWLAQKNTCEVVLRTYGSD